MGCILLSSPRTRMFASQSEEKLKYSHNKETLRERMHTHQSTTKQSPLLRKFTFPRVENAICGGPYSDQPDHDATSKPSFTQECTSTPTCACRRPPKNVEHVFQHMYGGIMDAMWHARTRHHTPCTLTSHTPHPLHRWSRVQRSISPKGDQNNDSHHDLLKQKKTRLLIEQRSKLKLNIVYLCAFGNLSHRFARTLSKHQSETRSQTLEAKK